jgi:uncharacterized protein DUF6226
MRGNQWGIEGPPREAYSRLTELERFEPLHAWAIDLLRRLEERFQVERIDSYGLDVELERVEVVRPTVRLVPSIEDAASIAVSFTKFPGLSVRFGVWHREGFPSCGCDACDETAEGEFARFEVMCHDVTAGRFRETINLPVVGPAWQEHEFWDSDGSRSSGRGRLDRSQARAMIAEAGGSSFTWLPWKPKKSPTSAA